VNLKRLSLWKNQLQSLPESIERWIEGLEKSGCSVHRRY